MKSFFVIALLVAVAAALPADPSKDAYIIRNDVDNIGVGGYNYGVETSDGKKAEEQGQLVNEGTENEALEVQGRFSYPGPDGQIIEVTYTAGVNGFEPKGIHLPS